MTEQHDTHFGFQQIPRTEKTKRVADVFHSVAEKYDLMNDLMSFGLHRCWKKFTLSQSNLRPGQKALDVAGGTGDLTLGFLKQVGPSGHVILSDINEKMLQQGRARLINKGFLSNVEFVQADAESLPFPDESFHCVSIAFGLRNVTNKEQALRSMYRVLKPGGKLLVLEFSQPVLPLLEKIYHHYSFKIIPKLGEWIAKDHDSYQYLVESIRMHPDQSTLANMIKEAGFEDVRWHNLSGGIVALHTGFRYS